MLKDIFTLLLLFYFVFYKNCYCTTIRKVTGSIPDGVIGIFHRHNPAGRIMALGLTSNRNEYQEFFLGGKRDWCIGLTSSPTSCPDCLEI
jgi:hypothetical protein